MRILKFFPSQLHTVADQCAFALLCLTPLFFLAVPRWMTSAITLTALVLTALLCWQRRAVGVALSQPAVRWLLLAFVAYPLAMLASDALRGQFDAHDYQDQLRLLLAVPLLLFVVAKRIDVFHIARSVVPWMVIAGTVSILAFPSANWAKRQTVQHIDPLSFGYLMLFLALLSVLLLLQDKGAKPLQKALYLVGAGLGLAMSVYTQSRSGWLALPIVVLFLCHTQWRLSLRQWLLAVGVLCFSLVLIYLCVPVVQQRLDVGVRDALAYNWDGPALANDTSLGLRMSFYRIGWYCMQLSPWVGWGSQNLMGVIDIPAIQTYATPFAIQFAAGGFFHNELLTRMTHYGVFGFLGFVLTFGIPWLLAWRAYRQSPAHFAPKMLLIYLIVVLVASLSTEVLVVKPMILFFGYIVACVGGTLAWPSSAQVQGEQAPR